MPLSCRCRSGLPADVCCGPLLSGAAVAPTAERLMRSRYTAFAVRDSGYLLRTWHRSSRPASLELDPRQHWIDLTIIARTGGGLLENRGTVEFEASYRLVGPDEGGSAVQNRSGEVHRHHEHSRFVREQGLWLYVGTV